MSWLDWVGLGLGRELRESQRLLEHLRREHAASRIANEDLLRRLENAMQVQHHGANGTIDWFDGAWLLLPLGPAEDTGALVWCAGEPFRPFGEDVEEALAGTLGPAAGREAFVLVNKVAIRFEQELRAERARATPPREENGPAAK